MHSSDKCNRSLSSKEDELYYILNENNKYITKKYIENTLKQYGVNIKVKNLSVFQNAMIHISYLVRDEKFYKSNKTKLYQIQTTDIEPIKDLSMAIPLQSKSYERKEFLGDAVVHLILAKYCYDRYPEQDEGFMTKLRTKIENGDTLSILAREIGLGEYIVISRNVELNEARDKNDKILEDAFEAFIGALYLETNFETCKKFIIRLIEEKIDFAKLLNKETNFKEKLSQFCHTRRFLDPLYGSLDVSGPENKKMYTMYVKCRKTVNDEGEMTVGVASKKKDAEQLASREMLIKFGAYKDEDESDDETVEYLTDSEDDSIESN